MKFLKAIPIASTEPRIKTKTWNITKDDGRNILIGQVRWHGLYKGYVFFGSGMAILDYRCLRELAIFCEEMTAENKSVEPRRMPQQPAVQ